MILLDICLSRMQSILMRLGTWIENKRKEAEERAAEAEASMIAGKVDVDNLVQFVVWQAREAAFREMQREMGYGL